MAFQTLYEVGDLTIGGTDFMAVLENVSWNNSPEFDEFTTPTRFRAARNGMKKAAAFDVALKPIKSAQIRVSHFDISVATLAGGNLIPEMNSMNLRIQNNIATAPSIGEVWRQFQTDPGGSITMDWDLDVAEADSVALSLLALVESDAIADLIAIASFSLNGVAVTLPGHLMGGSHSVSGRQKVSLQFEGSDPGGGTAYPTAPVGTSTILERALNAPRTPLAFTFVSKDVGGLSRSGYCLIESAEARIEDARIVTENYSFRVTGDVVTEITEA